MAPYQRKAKQTPRAANAHTSEKENQNFSLHVNLIHIHTSRVCVHACVCAAHNIKTHSHINVNVMRPFPKKQTRRQTVVVSTLAVTEFKPALLLVLVYPQHRFDDVSCRTL